MSRPLKLALAGLLLVILTWCALLILQKLQPYEEIVEHGPSPEAGSNEYLAAELFLRRQQIAVSRADGLDVIKNLPPEGQTLMLFAPRHNMTPRLAGQVLEWTAGGGHLVFVAEGIWDEEEGSSGDLLLDALGVQQHDTTTEDEEQPSAAEERTTAASAQDEPAAMEEDRYPELTKIYLENEEAPAYASFDNDFHLLDAGDRAYAWANSSVATHMLQMEHGQGLITVLTDAWLWQNRNIDQYDHAWLLWYLAQDSAVTLVHHAEHAGLFSQLLKHYPAALAALALLAGLLLWHVGLRHGPPLAPPAPARRQLEEHVRAGADFLLRRAGQKHLLSTLQHDILRRARQRHPGFERLPVAAQWQVLGRLTRLPSSAVSAAMRPPAAKRLSASELTRQVANLQTLRNAL